MRERENGGGISSRLKLEHQLKRDKILSDSSVSINILIRTYLICLSAIYLRHSYSGSFSVSVSVNVICTSVFKENNGLVEDRWRIPRTTSQCSTISFSQSVKLLASCGGELEKNRVQIHIRTVV